MTFVLRAGQLVDRLVVQVDAEIELGVIVGAVDKDPGRPLRQMSVVADLAAGIAPGLDRAQQAPLEGFTEMVLVARGDGLHHVMSRQHVAHRDIALAHLVSRIAAGLGTAIGRGVSLPVDDGDLAIFKVRVVGRQLVQDVRRRKSLGQQPKRQGVVALVHEGLRHGRAGIAAKTVAVEPDTDRVGRDADADLSATRTARNDSESHERSSSETCRRFSGRNAGSAPCSRRRC